MSEHESDQQQPGEPPPQEPEAAPEAGGGDQPPTATPRRLLRSHDDRVLGGVAGGLGKYFSVDPVFFRVGFVALAFLGGLGIFLYLAALLFVPSEDPSGGTPAGRSRALTIAGAIVLVILGAALLADGGWGVGFGFFFPLGFLILLGAGVWWLVWGRSGGVGDTGRVHAGRVLVRIAVVMLILVGSAVLFFASVWTAGIGGGVAVAVLIVAIGVLLVAAALRGGARWLILPALAIAAGLGIVSAADIDLRGGYGERVYAPTALAEVPDGYDLAAGRLEIDLRGISFPAGEHKLAVEVGFGEAVLVVPQDVCVVTDADVGAGYLKVLGWDDGGFNVAWAQRLAGGSTPKLLVDAHVGMGALQVVHDPLDAEWDHNRWEGRDGWKGFHSGGEDTSLGRSAACQSRVR
jgi:phage shock protein PspC (stress-responsive transcriptional regulator)